MKRKSFFLLEVMIAVALIAVFAYVALEGLYSSLGKQRKMLRQLEYARLVDGCRMELIQKYWHHEEKETVMEKTGSLQLNIRGRSIVLNTEQEFRVECAPCTESHPGRLNITEIRPREFKVGKRNPTYYYFVPPR